MGRQDGWIQTEAKVFTCGWRDAPYSAAKYGHTGDYLITFSYTVDGNYFSGEFLSSKELQEGESFPILYDPSNPERNSKSGDKKSSRIQLVIAFVVVAAGFVLYEWLHLKQ
jgi:hypothetical protein